MNKVAKPKKFWASNWQKRFLCDTPNPIIYFRSSFEDPIDFWIPIENGESITGKEHNRIIKLGGELDMLPNNNVFAKSIKVSAIVKLKNG